MSSPLFARHTRSSFASIFGGFARGRNHSSSSFSFVNYLGSSPRLNVCTIYSPYKYDVNYFNGYKRSFPSGFGDYRIRFFSTAPTSRGEPAALAGAEEDSQENVLNAVKAYSSDKNEDIADVVEELGMDSGLVREKKSLEQLFEIPDYHEYLMARITDQNGTQRSTFQEILPVDHIQHMFMAVHDYTGLSWSSTICLITLFFKVLLLPFWSSAERTRRLNAYLIPKAMELQEKAKQAFSTKNEKLAREAQMQIYEITRKNSFIKGVLVQTAATAVQGLMFGTVYGGLRLFAINPRFRPDFSCESCLWLDSLCLPDPYYILPCIFGILLTLVFEHNLSVNYVAPKSKGPGIIKLENRQKYLRIFSRVGIVFFTIYGFTMPASAFFYLIPSFLFQTVVRYSCNRFQVARFLGIPLPIVKKPKTP